jgi:hypothetical protein
MRAAFLLLPDGPLSGYEIEQRECRKRVRWPPLLFIKLKWKGGCACEKYPAKMRLDTFLLAGGGIAVSVPAADAGAVYP